MSAPRKRIQIMVGILCVLGLAPVTSCIGDPPREFDAYTPITVNIKRSAQQVWHPIGREVRLQADALDIDRWRFTGGCSEWNYLYTSEYLNYKWSGSTHLIPPFDTAQVKWCSRQLTGTAETIRVDVNDNGYISQVDPPDIGSRDDTESESAHASVNLGAFDVKASLTVSGTNGGPATWFTFWSQHDESLHQGEPGWVEPNGLFDLVSLAGGPVSLGVVDHYDTTITDASAQLPGITFRGEWVLSSEPDGKWTDDLTQYAGCFVDRYIVGALHSEVWDDDVDIYLSDYVTFSPSLPTFPSPLSWNWDRLYWDLVGWLGHSAKAEGGTGLGMIFTSNFFAGSSIWQSHSEAKHQSKDYTFLSETPNSKTVPFSYDWWGEWWQFDTSKEGNSIELRGDIQGKVEIVEDLVMVPSGVGYVNAYAKAWSDGWACFWLDEPYYSGTPNAPDPGFLP